jgi:hypothetical protein
MGGTPGTTDLVLPAPAVAHLAAIANGAQNAGIRRDPLVGADVIMVAPEEDLMWREPPAADDPAYQLVGAVPLAKAFMGGFPEFEASPAHVVQMPLYPVSPNSVTANSPHVPALDGRVDPRLGDLVRDRLFARWNDRLW